jgi:hypothetical protein
MLTFKEKVIKIVSNIPKGKTLSYKEVAKKAGNENGARAVGMIMSKVFLVIVLFEAMELWEDITACKEMIKVYFC